MLFFDRKYKMKSKQTMTRMQPSGTVPAPVSDHPSLSATKADLDRLYRDLEKVVPILQLHLQDQQIRAEPELASLLHTLWSTARDSRDGMLATRIRAGIKS